VIEFLLLPPMFLLMLILVGIGGKAMGWWTQVFDDDIE
jgi:hypothetical protein